MSTFIAHKKVFVALSGGVDSAVAAALLKREGHEVMGVFVRIQVKGLPCPAAADRLEAQRVAAHLRIPLREIDLSREYEQKVFNEMLASYKRGETPNPDVLCNREIKFGLLFEWVLAQGAGHLATGHYAQVREEGGEYLLYAGKDQEKDQSYFLWDVLPERLSKVLFPVGAFAKAQVRALAKQFDLPNARRKDSQGLCFLGEVSLEEVLRGRLKLKEGAVLDPKGNVIGAHRGAALYTLGERHGFALFASSPHTPPHYVVKKDMRANTITVSPTRSVQGNRRVLTLRETNWLGTVAGGPCLARFRYRQPLIEAKLANAKRSVEFAERELAAPGQSLVLYRGARCLGGGVTV